MSEWQPDEEDQRIIELARKARKERQRLAADAPRQPAKYDFAPGVAPDGQKYQVPEDQPKAD